MILIISTHENDIETDLICKNLIMEGRRFFKLTPELITHSKFRCSDEWFQINNRKLYFNQFSCVLIRRWNFRWPEHHYTEELSDASNTDLNIFLDEEWKCFSKHFFRCFNPESMITSPELLFMDKLEQLTLAKSCGLMTPPFIFENHQDPDREHQHFITKPITNLGYLFDRNHQTAYSSYTQSCSALKDYDSFGLSMIQKKIESQVELRVHYIHGETYTCGMYKEKSEADCDIKTSKFRCFRYQLPDEIESKIHLFMQNCRSKFGIIDMILQERNHVFIEINPIGKFAFYSSKCNLHIDQHLSKLIIKTDETFSKPKTTPVFEKHQS